MDALIFAAGLATLYAAHQVADHVFGQSDKIAENKVKPGRVGWSHIGLHIIQYHFVLVVILLATCVVLNLPVTLVGFTLCLSFSALSHAFIDRRWPVKWLLVNTGKARFADLTTPLCGMYLADQGLHYLCLWVSALLLTVG